MTIRGFSFDGYVDEVKKFHGHVAPGMVAGGFMVELALSNLPEGALFDAVSETRACIPDAVQLLTPCTIGNGWLKIVSTGRFALAMYDKHTGEGVRVAPNHEILDQWPQFKAWLFKLVPKKEQDTLALLNEIRDGGVSLFTCEKVVLDGSFLGGKKKNVSFIRRCVHCGEGFRTLDAVEICPACSGETTLYEHKHAEALRLISTPLENAVGGHALHDMTLIVPRKQKGPALVKGQRITEADIETLKNMGKNRVYLEEENQQESLVHENDVAIAFGDTLGGDGTVVVGPPKEGKVEFIAEHDGLFYVDIPRINRLNAMADVILATLPSYTPVCKGSVLAGTRAVPLFLSRAEFTRCMALAYTPLFSVAPYTVRRAGVIVTGTEIYEGRIKDAFLSYAEKTLGRYGANIGASAFVPDDPDVLAAEVTRMINDGLKLIITTGGLSVDPDDVTQVGLERAGFHISSSRSPVLPGAMTLLGRRGEVSVVGVPAGALASKKTAFDLILPRLLAGIEVTPDDVYEMGVGGLLV
ncbi:FmdE family protein [Desulfoluna sp.]|uniref:FmdE family protein n=1 Tax=Desulfoluna sp. TaxID=2045199 RepID=UPI00261696B2|nr:FmdE family protein [Desulfoluna sp.]